MTLELFAPCQSTNVPFGGQPFASVVVVAGVVVASVVVVVVVVTELNCEK